MRAEIVTEFDQLHRFQAAWDALAVACHRPRSAPMWVLAWYRRCATVTGTPIRVVLVHDGDVLVGVAPFHVTRSGLGFYRYDVAAPVMNGVEQLCLPGHEERVGAVMGAALAQADPTPDVVALPWLGVEAQLPAAIRSGWPRPSPDLINQHCFPAPRVELGHDDLDGWLASRSRNFRKSFRNDQRRILAAGFEHRVWSSEPDVSARFPDFRRLYEYRRATRGGTGEPFDSTLEAIVKDAVIEAEPGRVCLATIERPGEVIAADLIIRAGGEASAWFGGFDEKHAHLGASRVNVVMCIGDSFEAGDQVFDLGPGAEAYKASFTGDERTLQGRLLVRRGLRPFHTPAQLLPFRTRQAGARAVGQMLGRLRGPGWAPGPSTGGSA